MTENVTRSSLSALVIRTRVDTLSEGRMIGMRASTCQRSNSQCFFQICKTEPLCEVCHFVDERIREGYIVVVLELLLPILGIQHTLLVVRILEQTV